jgi:hypothetical protein
MIEAIKAEWLTAGKEKRHPATSNVLIIFRKHMKPRLNERQILELFELVFECYLEVTRGTNRIFKKITSYALLPSIRRH